MPKEPDLKFEILLREGWRTTEKMRAVADVLRTMGVVVASEGSAVVTVRVPASKMNAFVLMARKARLLDPDLESTFPVTDNEAIDAPTLIRDSVEIITMPSRHLQF